MFCSAFFENLVKRMPPGAQIPRSAAAIRGGGNLGSAVRRDKSASQGKKENLASVIFLHNFSKNWCFAKCVLVCCVHYIFGEKKKF